MPVPSCPKCGSEKYIVRDRKLICENCGSEMSKNRKENQEDIIRCMKDTANQISTSEKKEVNMKSLLEKVDKDTLIVLHGNPYARDHIYYLLNLRDESKVKKRGKNISEIKGKENGIYVDGKFSHWMLDELVPEEFERLVILQTTSQNRFYSAMKTMRKG